MHELAIVQSLLCQVGAVAAANKATAVRRVIVQVGPLSGVDPALLASAFEAARSIGLIAEAELVLESMPARVHCLACAVESEVPSNRLLCSRCGGFRTTLISGDEMILRRVELHVPEASDSARN